MDRMILIIMKLALISCLISGNVFAESYGDLNVTEVDVLLEPLKDPGWIVRDNALSLYGGLNKHLDDERVKEALLKLLKKETKFRKQNKRIYLGEEYDEYYHNLIDTVLKIEDPKIVPPIIETTEFIGFSQIEDRLAEFGDYAVEYLLKNFNSDSEGLRNAALSMVRRMVEKKSISFNIRSKVKRGFIKSALHDSFFTKLLALRGLGMLGDKDLIPLIKKISKEDPYVDIGKTGEKRYPIRRAALYTLDKLKDN